MPATTPPPAPQQEPPRGLLAVMEELLAEVKELREAFDAFSEGGFPLRQTAPTPEMLAAFLCCGSMIERDTPLSSFELEGRLKTAMLVSTQVVRQFDAYQAEVQRQALQDLASGGSS